MNVQYAIAGGLVYVLEVNPRASRTIPFVSKAIGAPRAELAARVMAGKTLKELGFTQEIVGSHVSVKEAVFPFVKFPNVDTILGPEMKSTGEVMAIDREFGAAYAKAQRAIGLEVPREGLVLVSVRDEDKAEIAEVARELGRLGLRIVATQGTATYLKENGVPADPINRVTQGSPHTVDLIEGGGVSLVIVTTRLADATAVRDSASMRRAALEHGVAYFTTVSGARAATAAIRAGSLDPVALQDIHPGGFAQGLPGRTT